LAGPVRNLDVRFIDDNGKEVFKRLNGDAISSIYLGGIKDLHFNQP